MRHMILATVLLCTGSVSATEQGFDTIMINGEKHSVVGRLMKDYWIDHGPQPEFDSPSTANWKGYTAEWELRDGQLYLTHFTAKILNEPYDISAELKSALPALATWVSGPVYLIDNVEERPAGWHSKGAKRYHFKSGRIQGSPEIIDDILCRTEDFGIGLTEENGKIIVAAIARLSIASSAGDLAVGTIIESVIGYDGNAIDLSNCTPGTARGYMRRLKGQPLTLCVRSPNTDNSVTVILQRPQQGS